MVVFKDTIVTVHTKNSLIGKYMKLINPDTVKQIKCKNNKEKKDDVINKDIPDGAIRYIRDLDTYVLLDNDKCYMSPDGIKWTIMRNQYLIAQAKRYIASTIPNPEEIKIANFLIRKMQVVLNEYVEVLHVIKYVNWRFNNYGGINTCISGKIQKKISVKAYFNEFNASMNALMNEFQEYCDKFKNKSTIIHMINQTEVFIDWAINESNLSVFDNANNSEYKVYENFDEKYLVPAQHKVRVFKSLLANLNTKLY